MLSGMRSGLLAPLLSLGLSLASPVQADTDWISLIWHNDLFVGTDGGGYTNGAYLSWYDLSDTEPEAFSPPWLTRPFLGWLIEREDEDFEVSGHTVGQAMVTPRDISRSVPEANDAPYAGMLSWRSTYIRVSDRQADSLSITLGIVGPSSGAEQAQKFIHKVTGSTRPQGWRYQIQDEPLGQIERARTWRFGPDSAGDGPGPDLVAHARVAVGNLQTSVGSGLFFRYGTRLDRSFATVHQVAGRVSNPMAIDGGWNVYLGAGADYVYNQIAISGSGIRSGPGSELRRDQYALFGGLSYSWSQFSASLSLVANTNPDAGNSARHRFGNLTLAWKI